MAPERPSRRVVLLGLNGAGKTRLAQALADPAAFAREPPQPDRATPRAPSAPVVASSSVTARSPDAEAAVLPAPAGVPTELLLEGQDQPYHAYNLHPSLAAPAAGGAGAGGTAVLGSAAPSITVADASGGVAYRVLWPRLMYGQWMEAPAAPAPGPGPSKIHGLPKGMQPPPRIGSRRGSAAGPTLMTADGRTVPAVEHPLFPSPAGVVFCVSAHDACGPLAWAELHDLMRTPPAQAEAAGQRAPLAPPPVLVCVVRTDPSPCAPCVDAAGFLREHSALGPWDDVGDNPCAFADSGAAGGGEEQRSSDGSTEEGPREDEPHHAVAAPVSPEKAHHRSSVGASVEAALPWRIMDLDLRSGAVAGSAAAEDAPPMRPHSARFVAAGADPLQQLRAIARWCHAL